MKITAHSVPAILALCFFSACTTVCGADQTAEKKIVLGAKYSDASKLLSSGGGSAEEERRYSVEVDPAYSVHYHPLREGVDLVATVEKASGKITFLALMTTPAHRPVKGLEVDIPISEFRLDTDGSFSVTVPPAAPSKGDKPPK